MGRERLAANLVTQTWRHIVEGVQLNGYTNDKPFVAVKFIFRKSTRWEAHHFDFLTIYGLEYQHKKESDNEAPGAFLCVIHERFLNVPATVFSVKKPAIEPFLIRDARFSPIHVNLVGHFTLFHTVSIIVPHSPTVLHHVVMHNRS